MIRCILYLDFGGISPIDEWEVLGRIDIENELARTLSTDGKRGDYSAIIYKKRKTPWSRRPIKIKNFPRLSYHPWNLILEILKKAAEKNGGRL